MAYDPGLAQRVRESLGERSGVSERAMFGGLAFLVDGKMFVGVSGSRLMARIGKEHYADALAMPNVREMAFTGRPFPGYVYIEARALAEDSELNKWVTWCVNYVSTIPSKTEK